MFNELVQTVDAVDEYVFRMYEWFLPRGRQFPDALFDEHVEDVHVGELTTGEAVVVVTWKA